ncbi:MAG: hypothetical protein V1884_00045 [Candidatus Omnitrophota bacterium]
MRKIKVLFILVCLFNLLFPGKFLLAESGPTNTALDESVVSDEWEARYILLMMKGRSVQNTRVPVIILDSFQGIIWTCRNLQEDRPTWIRTDLGKNQEPLSRKKYTGRVLEWQDANSRMPAIILDTEGGKAWTCSDIITNGDIWVETDFKNVLRKEIRGTEVKF